MRFKPRATPLTLVYQGGGYHPLNRTLVLFFGVRLTKMGT